MLRWQEVGCDRSSLMLCRSLATKAIQALLEEHIRYERGVAHVASSGDGAPPCSQIVVSLLVLCRATYSTCRVGEERAVVAALRQKC